MKEIREIGIYGGTFSPPHFGHINAVKTFINQINPVVMLIVPTSIPPHKNIDSNDDPSQRLDMLKLVFGENSKFIINKCIIIDDYEIKKTGISYTFETLEHYNDIYPKSEGYRLNFLCGTDMFLTLDKWKCPEKIFLYTRIAFMRREKNSDIYMKILDKISYYTEHFNADIVEINGDIKEISSTEIRNAILSEDKINSTLPRPVLEYIIKNKLYR